MSDVSLTFNLLSNDRASSGIARAANNVRAANVSSAASAITLAAAEASAAAWAVSLGSAISGAIGLAPAVFAGAAAAGVGLKLALGGLGGAWKALGQQQASAGPSSVNIARQQASAADAVTTAQEQLARAQRDAADAQKAESDAIETATKNLRDLTLSLAEAKLDEQSATLAVKDAQEQLISVQQHGNDPEEVQKATIAYQQSVLALQEAKNKTSDLSEETTKATAAGVTGSDAYQAAQRQQLDATQAITDATRQLAEAQQNLASVGQTGGGASASQSAAALAMAKLSANGRDVILTLKQLAPAWSGVQRLVQNNAFAGVSGDLRQLSATYLPVLTDRLGGMGRAFNVAIRSSLGVLQTRQSVSDVNTILGSTNLALTRLGRAFAPIISGFLGMGAAGSAFLPMIAGWIGGLADSFDRWVTSARQSGQLATWLSTAETALHDLWIIAGNVAGVIGQIFAAKGVSSGGTQLLGTIVKLTGNLRAFLGTAKGKQDVSVFFADLRNILGTVATAIPKLLSHVGDLQSSFTLASTVTKTLADHAGLVAKVLPFLAAGWALSHAAQSLAVIRDLIHLPILAASAVANFLLATAIRAQIAATEQATIAEEELDAAFLLSPIGLVVAGIVALIAVVVIIATKTTWFQTLWDGAWKGIKGAAKAVWDWIKGNWPYLLGILTGPIGLAAAYIYKHWDQVVGFIQKLPGRIAKVARGMWDGIKNTFRDTLNWLIGRWNGLHFGVNVPSSVFGIPIPGGGGSVGFGVPQIPYLASGGTISRSGMAVVGERGPEVVSLPAGATVHPNGTGPGGGTIVLRAADGDRVADVLLSLLRPVVSGRYGGNVQVALGGRSS